MIKDILNKITEGKDKKNIIDKITNSIMDGYVDIKAYNEKDGKKELIYHDTGDNTVTDWMRHAIMVMLTGAVFSKNGDGAKGLSLDTNFSDSYSSLLNENQYSAPDTNTSENKIAHTVGTSTLTGTNQDGYLLNGKQYFWKTEDYTGHYSAASSKLGSNYYALFPTKVLLGTGKEYDSWATLQSENESENQPWYANMLNEYGGTVSEAQAEFDANISISSNGTVKQKNCNVLSGSISNNVYSSDAASISRMRTVNDPSTDTSARTNTSTMSKNFNVVGAIKTCYFNSTSDSSKLMSSISSEGRLLKPTYRGIGRPCFIYFNTSTTNENWRDTSAEVILSNDSSLNYLNKITFSITMPSQSAVNDAIGAYYPYNGYTLRQIGLYNDARLSKVVSAVGTDEASAKPYNNMPCGMLLAVKNIAAFTKIADTSVTLTWTLTI
jgi:hypothetical protein